MKWKPVIRNDHSSSDQFFVLKTLFLALGAGVEDGGIHQGSTGSHKFSEIHSQQSTIDIFDVVHMPQHIWKIFWLRVLLRCKHGGGIEQCWVLPLPILGDSGPAIFTPSLFILRLTPEQKFARILPNIGKNVGAHSEEVSSCTRSRKNSRTFPVSKKMTSSLSVLYINPLS